MTRPHEFECAPGLRLEALERVSALREEASRARIDRLEAMIERLERRLWLAVYGIVAAILAQTFQGILAALP